MFFFLRIYYVILEVFKVDLKDWNRGMCVLICVLERILVVCGFVFRGLLFDCNGRCCMVWYVRVEGIYFERYIFINYKLESLEVCVCVCVGGVKFRKLEIVLDNLLRLGIYGRFRIGNIERR